MFGAWLSPVERTVRVREVPSSNLGAPTRSNDQATSLVVRFACAESALLYRVGDACLSGWSIVKDLGGRSSPLLLHSSLQKGTFGS